MVDIYDKHELDGPPAPPPQVGLSALGQLVSEGVCAQVVRLLPVKLQSHKEAIWPQALQLQRLEEILRGGAFALFSYVLPNAWVRTIAGPIEYHAFLGSALF